MSWFHTRPVAPGVWLVAEPGHVNCWLVAGTERAVLLDTGLGVAPIRPVAQALTPVPVEAVNSHYHFDHTGGNAEFDRVAIHELGVPLLAGGVPPAVRSGYLDYTRRLLAAAETYRDLDRDYFHLLSADSDPRPLPDGFVPDGWDPPPGIVTDQLVDGDVLDLGGRTLTVLHTPGHSPDSVCFLDDRDGLLFGGDTLNTGPIYAQMPDSDVTAFAHSTARLAELHADIRLVLMCHFGRGIVEAQFVREVADAFDQLVNEDVRLRPARDCLLDEAREAVFPQCSILVAPEARS
ncbi:MAG TPA: MBL fold metallo-hydrolase [Frankiaceae bacterium]|nr:MBL fold metallo-hydrolase [Frankiaceae bacterium]